MNPAFADHRLPLPLAPHLTLTALPAGTLPWQEDEAGSRGTAASDKSLRRTWVLCKRREGLDQLSMTPRHPPQTGHVLQVSEEDLACFLIYCF